MRFFNLDPTEAAFWRVGIFVSIILLLASTMPPGLVLASFGALSKTGAVICLAAAALRREKLRPDALTRWDEAAALFLAGCVADLFIDRAEVTGILRDSFGMPLP